MSVTLRKIYIGDKALKKKNRPYKFQLGIYREGKRRREIIKDLVVYPDEPLEYKKEKIKIAENIRSSYQIELNTKRYGFSSSLKKKQNFIEYFKKQMEQRTKVSQLPWENCLKYLLKFEGDNFTFEFVTKEWIEDFIKFVSSHVSLSSTSTYTSKLKCALNHAVKDQIIQDNPFLRVDPIRYQRNEIGFLLEDEIKELIDTPFFNQHVRLAFLFSCFTGLRQSDIRNLKWENIRGDKIHFKQQKTKKAEIMPISETAKSFLPPRGKSAYVFHLGFHSGSINRSLKKWFKQTSITKRITFHCARHTFATLLVTQGVNIYTVSKLLGHSDIKSTMIYAKVIDKEKENAISLLPSF